MTDYKKHYIWCRNYINDNCIHRVGPGENKLPGKTPGSQYMWQFYLNRATHNNKFVESFKVLFWHEFGRMFYVNNLQLGACELAGVPLAISIQTTSVHPLYVFTVRKEPKTYGLKNRLEGHFHPWQDVLLIDDLLASGDTMSRAVTACEEAGLNVYACVGIVYKKHQYQIKDTVPVSHYLYTLDDFDLFMADYCDPELAKISETSFLEKAEKKYG